MKKKDTEARRYNADQKFLHLMNFVVHGFIHLSLPTTICSGILFCTSFENAI
jgi:hypothetical protein